jgi:hypothetical protein
MLQKITASIQSGFQTILVKKYINLLFLILSLILGYFFGFDLAIILLILSVSIINNFSSKTLIIGSLVLLISVPLLLIFEKDIFAEKIAVYVYYLLICTAILEIIAYIKIHTHRAPKLNSIITQESEPIVQNTLQTDQKPILQLTSKRMVSMEFQRPVTLSAPIKKLTSPEPTVLPPNLEETKKIIDTKNVRSLFGDLSSTNLEEEPKLRFKLPKFNLQPKSIFEYWNHLVIIIAAAVPIFLFRFAGLPSFRDLTTVPYVYNIQSGPFDLNVIENYIFNQFTRLLRPEAVSSIFFQFFFFVGTILTYFYLLKIQARFTSSTTLETEKNNKVLIFLISLLYVYNPFTFERFLMGQHFVLRGHLLFIPVLFYLLGFVTVFKNFKKADFYLFSEKNISAFSNFGWAITLISLLSTHHGLFAIYLLAISLIFILISNFKYLYSYFRRTDVGTSFNTVFKIFSIFLLVILPSVIIFINRYGNSPQLATFDKQQVEKSDTKKRIISAFSLKVLDDQNLVTKALIGAASWNTPSFSETTSIAASLGNVRKLSVYYSPKLNFLLIVFMAALIGYCAYLADRHFKPLLFPFLVLLPILLILNFGYSGNFENINSLFFNLPFSYTFREAGKFYSLFLALLAVILVSYSQYFIERIKFASLAIFGVLLIGNLIVFLPLSQNIVYADYPQILKDVSATCKRSDKSKVLLLPFNTYINPSYSGIFTANFSKSLLNCEVLSPDYATLENRESANKISDTIELSNSKVSKSINGIITTFTKSGSNDTNAYENLRKDLKIFGVYTLIVDETNYADTSAYDLGVFSKKLQQFISPDLSQKDDNISISVFNLK